MFQFTLPWGSDGKRVIRFKNDTVSIHALCERIYLLKRLFMRLHEVGGIFQLFAAYEQHLIEQHERNIGDAFFVLGIFELLHDRMIAFISRLNPHSNRAMLDCRIPIF